MTYQKNRLEHVALTFVKKQTKIRNQNLEGTNFDFF
jgi:hypothetical protein